MSLTVANLMAVRSLKYSLLATSAPIFATFMTCIVMMLVATPSTSCLTMNLLASALTIMSSSVSLSLRY